MVDLPGRPTSMWAEVRLDAEWTVSYRVVVQGGSLTIGEVRIFPAAQTRSHEWGAGDLDGLAAAVPPGGLVARLLRAPTPGAHLAEIQRTIAWADLEVAYARRRGLSRRQAPFSSTGMMGSLGIEKPRNLTTAPRRTQVSHYALAKAAAAYVQALESGSRKTTVAVATRVRVSETKARDMVHRARVAGILEPSRVRQGRPEGRLSDYGRAVLMMK